MTLTQFLGVACGILAFLVVLQARVVWVQRAALKVAWERVRTFREELATADALMSTVNREKVAAKGTAR